MTDYKFYTNYNKNCTKKFYNNLIGNFADILRSF